MKRLFVATAFAASTFAAHSHEVDVSLIWYSFPLLNGRFLTPNRFLLENTKESLILKSLRPGALK